MKITAFLHNEDFEPTTVDDELEVTGADEDSVTLAQWVQDTFGDRHLGEIHVVSENVATIALHALHGVLTATDEAKAGWPEDPAGLQAQITQARAWALAALEELAFYDCDGIETDLVDSEGRARALDDPSFAGDLNIAADPGREVAGKLFAGQTHQGAKPFVNWPDA